MVKGNRSRGAWEGTRRGVVVKGNRGREGRHGQGQRI